LIYAHAELFGPMPQLVNLVHIYSNIRWQGI